MASTPDGKPAESPEHETIDAEWSPTPGEVLRLVGQWLRHRLGIAVDKPKWTEVFTAVLTLILAIAAIVSAWLFQGQLTVARKTMQAQTRPWLVNDGPASYEIGQYFKEQDLTGITFTFQVKNFGPSPGLDVGEGIQPWVRTSGDTHEFDDARKKACQSADSVVNVASQTIFPQQTISYSTGGFLSKVGNIKMVLFSGCIAYRDQFDPAHTTHHTTFCVFGPIAEPHSLGLCGINEIAD